MERQKRLELAREQRILNAEALDNLRYGTSTIVSVIQEPTDVELNIPIYDLMKASPGLGDKKIKTILQRCNIWPKDRLKDLSDEDVEMLTSLLSKRSTISRP